MAGLGAGGSDGAIVPNEDSHAGRALDDGGDEHFGRRAAGGSAGVVRREGNRERKRHGEERWPVLCFVIGTRWRKRPAKASLW